MIMIRKRLVRVLCVVLLLGMVGAAQGCRGLDRWLAGEPESKRQYNSARGIFNRQRYAEASVAFRAWLADYRDSEDVLRPLVLYKLGECYRLTRDYEHATATYMKLVEMYAKSADAAVQKLVGQAKLRLDDITPKAGKPKEPKTGPKPEPTPSPEPEPTPPSPKPEPTPPSPKPNDNTKESSNQ